MKNSVLSFLTLLLLSTVAFGASGDWITDFDAAMEKAKAEGKPVLINYTGSDWCGWCIKLDKEIFSQAAFQDYAKENLVLLEVDFPKNKEQSAELKKQNQQLQERHGIRGYPTLVVLNPEGEEIGRLGYMKGGPDPFIEKLKDLKKS